MFKLKGWLKIILFEIIEKEDWFNLKKLHMYITYHPLSFKKLV